MEDAIKVLTTFKKIIPKFILGSSILFGMGSILAQTPTEVNAAHTTITKVDTHDKHSTIHVNHDGRLELPDGSQVNTKTIRYDVSMNGVYTFHTYSPNDVITRDSALIDTIMNKEDDLLRTNKDTVELTISSRDNLSGLQQYRLRNESNGNWSDWKNVTSSDNQVRQTIDWKLNTSSEGIRTVYSQFKDKAGNITETDVSSKGSTRSSAPYARVVYTTQGPQFDVGIVDLNKMGSTYWVSPNRTYVVKRSNNPYVELVFNNIRSEWSTPQYIYTSVNGQPFNKQPLSALSSDGRLIVDIPQAERKNGSGKIRIYIDDLVVNHSDIHTIDYYYDDTEPTVSTTIRQGDGSALENVIYYNQVTKKDETHKLTKTQNVLLNVIPSDGHSSMNRQEKHPGFARIFVQEQTRYEQDGNWKNNKRRVYAKNEDVADGHPFTSINLVDGNTHQLNIDLTHGFETRFMIEVTDNAGNTRRHYTDPFRQSNLRLVSFKILEIVNPSREDDEVIITEEMDIEDVPRMSAGANVTVEPTFDFVNAFDYEKLHGTIEIIINGPNGYKYTQHIQLKEEDILNDKQYPRFIDTFTVPDDAPVGSEVIMRGWLSLNFADDVSHTIYFPSKNGAISWRIGIIGNHIQDHLRFNITR